MALPDLRTRARYLFVAVMVGHILLISSQVNSPRGIPLLQEGLTAVVVEVQRTAGAVAGAVRGVWHAYVGLRGVQADNDRLSREVVDLRVQLQQQRALAHGAELLRQSLDLRTRVEWPTVAAEVIAGSVAPGFRSLTIDKGERVGVEPDMAVIAAAGVVGRVVNRSARAASVQMLIDENAAASVMVERSSAQGIALGEGDGTLRLEYLSAVADVREGDLVVTAGLDAIYPKGLPVGVVSVVEKAGPAYRRVLVRPVVDFSSLEIVLVVLSRQGPAPEGSA